MIRMLVGFGMVAVVTASPLSGQDLGIDQKAMDRSVRVQDDLYGFVNGTWLKNTEIPSDKSNYGSFVKLIDKSQAELRQIIEEVASQDHASGSEGQKLADFYNSFMDEARVEELGIKPLEEEIAKIRALDSKEAVVKHFGYLKARGVQTPMGFFVTQDNKNSTQYLAALMQSGTTLPDRSYYLKDDEKFVKIRESLQNFVGKLLTLSGCEDADTASKAIVELEKRLAEVQWERVQLRDAEKRYNKFTVEKLIESYPKLQWGKFLEQAGAGSITEINVMTPSFFEGLDKIFDETSVDVWRQYLEYKLVDAYAPFLSKPFVDEHFELHSRVLAGVPEQKPRWKRAVDAASGAGAGDFGVLGEVVGKFYVERHFKADAKARMDELVENLMQAYKQSIDELAWMTDATKKRAQEKLSKITRKIGYPDKWLDYSKLVIAKDDLVGNVMRSNDVEYNRMIDRLGKPVDRQRWGMTPHTVNAYYNPTLNEIVFPAAILQSPFFNVSADDAINYGGIGAVIGHEISHAFDDQGSRYDGDGNLRNWWTDTDRHRFKELTTKLVAQYDVYEPLPGRNVQGKLTLGENIADLSGLAIAFKAYKIANKDREIPKIDGFSGEQRFFLGWSQVWRRKYRDAEMIRRLATDPHSPSQYRANGPVINMDAFYEAFAVKEGDAMFKPKEERIKIW